MKIVQMHQLINQTESMVNRFLASIPQEDIISVSFHLNGTETNADEYVIVFYKTNL